MPRCQDQERLQGDHKIRFTSCAAGFTGNDRVSVWSGTPSAYTSLLAYGKRQVTHSSLTLIHLAASYTTGMLDARASQSPVMGSRHERSSHTPRCFLCRGTMYHAFDAWLAVLVEAKIYRNKHLGAHTEGSYCRELHWNVPIRGHSVSRKSGNSVIMGIKCLHQPSLVDCVSTTRHDITLCFQRRRRLLDAADSHMQWLNPPKVRYEVPDSGFYFKHVRGCLPT